MEVNLPDEVVHLFDLFTQSGHELYIVGGAVRDLLTGRDVTDWDYTTDATPEEMLKLIPDSYYNNEYGMVGVPSGQGIRPHEITTYRTESGYTDKRHPDKIEWGKTLEEDLSRRDFTINAMAMKVVSVKGRSAHGGREKQEVILIDPYDGQKDLENKLLRAVGDPDERFKEDALRLMRAVRIATQLGFLIETKTFNAIKANVISIQDIAVERVQGELLKLLAAPYPYEGLMVLRSSGLMSQILPELESTFGVEQASPGRHHIYDVGTHLLMSVKSLKSNDPIVRLATLIHDVGKAKTFKKLENGTITFYNHEMVSARIADRIAKRLRFSNKDAERLVKLVRWHMFSVDERQTDSAIRRFIKNIGPENLDDIIALRVADRLGGGARETSWRLEEFKKRLVEVQLQPFSIRDLKISGTDVMEICNIPPGPKVGEILEDVFEKVVEKQLENERETLLMYLKTKILD